jgi:hypothetical protein
VVGLAQVVVELKRRNPLRSHERARNLRQTGTIPALANPITVAVICNPSKRVIVRTTYVQILAI